MTVTRKQVIQYAAGPAVALAVLLSTASACSSSSNGNAAESASQQTDTSMLESNQPLPEFPTSAYRQEVIEIEAIEALGAPTTAFFFPEGTTVVDNGGKQSFSAPPVKVCPAEGEPVPNTASLSNPDQVVDGQNGTSDVVGQMDPNGVYVPQSSSGTYVLCDNANGGQKLAYWEGPVFDESGTAQWSSTDGIVDIGSTALPTCTVVTSTDSSGNSSSYEHCTFDGKSANSTPSKSS